VNEKITWTTLRAGRYENRAGREFLQRTGLVRLPRTADIFERLAAVLQGSRDRQLHESALRFAFNLTRGRRYGGRPALRELNLRVPVLSGDWIGASDALFSAGWPGTLGTDLERLLTLTAGASAALDAMRPRILVRPTDFEPRPDPIEDWVAFLVEIGVRDGLWPMAVDTKLRDRQGYWWASADIADEVELPEQEKTAWVAELRCHYAGDGNRDVM
jgi:hypothetical protein